MRHTFATMGTVVSLDVGVPGPTLTRAVEDVFMRADELFSLYRPGSELSRIAAGTLDLQDSSHAVRDAYALALAWSSRTNGSFTPNRPDGAIDLNGVVKALAMTQASELVEAAGCTDWTLNVGGDILVSDNVEPHVVGITDPNDRATLLCSLTIAHPRRAVATSGSSERGDHIWLAGGTTSPEFVQATVVAKDIITADVLATAIIASGSHGLDDITDRWDVDVLTVARDGTLRATPGLRAALATSRELQA